jgi:hypothetical protein
MMKRGMGLVVAFAVALGSAPAVEAGILDSIKSLFGGAKEKASGLFGGGGDKQVQELIEQVQASQREVATKQEGLTAIYNGKLSDIKPGDAAVQGKLDELRKASASNEQLFLRLLQVRADISGKEGGDKALAPFSEAIGKVTSTQNQLEQNYQKIQETNRQAGFFKPTGEGGDELASGTSGSSAAMHGHIWEDPDAQRYIDEWLGKVSLNEWGQWIGSTKSARIKSAGPAEGGVGKTRHEAVWKMYSKDDGNSNITLAEYVEARMNGENPQVVYTPPSGGSPGGGSPGGGGVETLASQVVTPAAAPAAPPPAAAPVAPPPVAAAPVAAQGTTQAGTAASGTRTSAAELTTIDASLKTNYGKLTELTKAGQGSGPEAKQVLKDIEALQGQRVELIRKQQQR